MCSAATSLLDEFMPSWDMRERHAARIDADPDRVLAATAATTWAEAFLARALSNLVRNKVPADQPFIDTFGGLEGALARSADELVFGAISPMRGDGPVHKGLGPEEFRAFAQPGHSKVGFNFHYRDRLLVTETRVALTDDRSKRMFGLYWALIRPFSGLTRRSMLAAIERRLARDSS